MIFVWLFFFLVQQSSCCCRRSQWCPCNLSENSVWRRCECVCGPLLNFADSPAANVSRSFRVTQGKFFSTACGADCESTHKRTHTPTHSLSLFVPFSLSLSLSLTHSIPTPKAVCIVLHCPRGLNLSHKTQVRTAHTQPLPPPPHH